VLNPAHAPVATPARRHAAAALTLLCTAMFVLQLDFSIVNVALATIQDELHFSPAELQWVVTGYAVTFGSLLLVGGRTGDIVGRRRLFAIGLAVFAAASLTCGLARSPLMLVVSRIVQGTGGAMVSPAALSLLTSRYPEGPARNHALGIWQASAAGGASAGAVLGGLLTQYVGWRGIFLINVPIALVVLALLPRVLEADGPRRAERIDVLGGGLVTVALAALIFGLSNGEQNGFASAGTVVAMTAFVLLLVVFVAIERRTASPMLPHDILSSPTRRGSDAAMLLMGVTVAAYAYFNALYLQRVLGFSPLVTGLCFLPATATVMLMSTFGTRRLLDRVGVKGLLLAGLVSMGIGQFWLSHVSDGGSYRVNVLPGMLLTALGLGLGFPSASVGATAGVARRDHGLAAALLNTSQQVGSAVGLAVLATIAATRTDQAHGSLADGYALSYGVATGVVLLAVVLVVTQLHAPARQGEMARLFAGPRSASTAKSSAWPTHRLRRRGCQIERDQS
jgi:EmrB/QacA subfamily drug resistance transporter